MNLRLIDWIWHVRGSLPLQPGQSSSEVFDRLSSLFQGVDGTTNDRVDDTLTFSKKDQAAQDKLSVFDKGVLHVQHGATGSVLRYHLISRALLFCFLAPLLFLAFAQLSLVLAKHPKASADAAHKPAKKEKVLPLNPIDKFLGAPAPEAKKKKDEGGGGDEEGGGGKKPSTTPAYVFASIFAVLYLVGRILEDRLVRRLFSRRIRGA